MTRSGLVPIVGRPNVGKSTLVNALVGHKVSIVSPRPQTTRNTVRGVVTGPRPEAPEWQLVLIDTPGIHKPRTELGNRLNRIVYGTLAEADVVVFVVDATQPIGPGDRLVAERLHEAGAVVVVVVNKTDAASRGAVAAQLAEANGWDFAAYVPLSALRAENLAPLVEEVLARVPEGPLLFPAEAVSDQLDHQLAGEIVREKFLVRLRDEVPHSVVVVVDDLTTRPDGLVVVTARVLVERESQRAIVIGKGGSLLRDAGTEARTDLEMIFGSRVHLDLRVAVEPEWQRRPASLDRLGFGG